MIKIELPPKYYLAHFQELREILLAQYGSFFEQTHHDFFRDFDALSEDGQCLYLRLVNRKGRMFFREKLKYKEIENWDGACAELFTKKFVRSLSPEDWKEYLSFIPRARLSELASLANVQHKRSWPREKIEEELIAVGFMDQEEIIIQERTEELTYLLFLFFGKIQDNLSLYTLRDLGVRKKGASKSKYKSRFETHAEARSHYFYARLHADLENSRSIEDWPIPLNLESQGLREEVLLHLAEEHRRAEDFSKSLSVLQYSRSHPGREKRVRLLHQLGMIEECKKELSDILEMPYTDGEYLFAEDFYGRKFQGRKRSILTETLRQARKISIDESYFRHPEMGVQDHLKTLGVDSLHLENYLWNALFGLLFWEELFESEKTGLFNEFERRPKDLYSSKFHELHETEIESKLALLNLDYLLEKFNQKHDTLNGVFAWSDKLPEYLTFFLSHAPLDSVRAVLVHMAKDYSNRSTGFPDLMAVENGKVKFFEVKAEGDALKQTQLLQMIALQKAGFDVEVIQVEYTFNPNQLYVVVDIETTGGSLPFHRITELGAVKIRNGEIVDKYQTLVNPQRWISREIEALTGISNEMVKSAPLFRDVAEAFDEFTKDAIFVAHNVNFDYGFIQAEYDKLEMRFVRPFICTKVGMRKHYPGLPSYSLKNLTQEFKISLETHHRALCDAEAASGLLRLINEKRREKSSV